jgi:hypothetical protein
MTHPPPLPVREDDRMGGLVTFLRDRNMADNHAYAEVVAHRFSGEAILDNHLPMLEMVDLWPGNTRQCIRRMPATQVSRTRSTFWRSRTSSTPATVKSGFRRTRQRATP